MGDISLLNLDKTGQALVNRTADFIGGGFKPCQIRRVAQAEADAKVILAKADIDIDRLRQRALKRIGNEQIREQQNIEDIVCLALEQLSEDAHPDKIDDDWMAFFFNKCKLVSNDKLKEVWGKILAGEATAAGSFSKRTLEILSSISQNDAEGFSKLCSFVCDIDGGLSPLIFSLIQAKEFYISQQLTFNVLMNLESVGLIHLNGSDGFLTTIIDGSSVLNYFGEKYRLTKPKKMPGARPVIRSSKNVFCEPTDKDIDIDIGMVALTSVGEELFKICESKPVSGFLDFLIKVWEISLDFVKIEHD